MEPFLNFAQIPDYLWNSDHEMIESVFQNSMHPGRKISCFIS